jgi:hypothetical protein
MTAPYTANWIPGSVHTIAVSTPQTGTDGNVYTFSSWSDGGAASHTITVPQTSGTYTATMVAIPSISSISQNGALATITGHSLGAPGTVMFNQTAAAVSSWTSTQIVVTIPSGTGSSNIVVTTAAGLASSPFAFAPGQLPAPTGIAFSLPSGPPLMGFVITGSGLAGGASVTIGGLPAASTWNQSTSSITVQVPQNAPSGWQPVVVSVPGSAPTAPVMFNVTGTFGCGQ